MNIEQQIITTKEKAARNATANLAGLAEALAVEEALQNLSDDLTAEKLEKIEAIKAEYDPMIGKVNVARAEATLAKNNALSAD